MFESKIPCRDSKRSAWLMAGALVVLSPGCGDGQNGLAQSNDSGESEHVASPACPLRTAADWRTFRETTVDDPHWVKTCSSQNDCDDAVGAFRSHVESDVLDVFQRCASDLLDNPPILRCTANLRRFTSAWTRQHTPYSYGFIPDNAAYLAGETGPDEPAGMMDPPAEIVAALPARAQLEAAARANGWPYLTHDSALGGVRTFVVVADPNARFEQWLLVGLDPELRFVPDASVMSFIAIQKKDASGRDLSRARLHFRDYIAWNAGSAWRLALPEAHDAKCYACHTSGMRLLVPTHESVVASLPVKGEAGYGDANVPADYGFQRLTELNRRLLAYGLLDWNGAVVPADHGPPLGASLGCTRCHDGVVRGTLSVSSDEHMLERKLVHELSMRSLVGDKSVPDEGAIALLDREKTRAPALSFAEQAELERARAEHLADYRALVAERFPVWRAWVLSEPCD